MRYRSVAFLLMSALAGMTPLRAGGYEFQVEGAKTLVNGQPFLVKGLRVSNALMDDFFVNSLIASLNLYKSYGVNTVSVFFMGSRFGDVKGYREDASLDPVYAARMGRIIEAADQRGMVVLVGCLYWGDSKAKWEHWTQREANLAVENTVHWLHQKGYRNVFVDIDNEGMARAAKGFDNRELVLAAKRASKAIMVAVNYKGEPPAEADLTIHHSPRVQGKPYIESEGSPRAVPTTGKQGGYWGSYSKQEGLYQYIRIGEYTDAMKQSQLEATREHLARGDGYMLASTWLQCVPPLGPQHDPGGMGAPGDPGIRWWLEALRKLYGGPWTPPPPR